MHIHTIEIRSIRALGAKTTLELVLQPLDDSLAGWHVVVGPNGCGKSTLLKAIALACVGPDVGYHLQSLQAWWLSKGASAGWIKLIVQKGHKDLWKTTDGYRGVGRSEPIELRVEVQADEVVGASSGGRARSGAWLKKDKPRGWFVAGYGASRRLGGEGPRPSEARPVAQLMALFSDERGLAEPLAWLKQLKLEADEGKAARTLLPKLLGLISDGLLPGSAKAVGVSSEGLEIREFGLTLPMASLSDGYQSTLALVLNIIRQLHLAHDPLDFGERAGRTVVENEGVVLIDEIEAHLHPAWQRRIGSWFVEHFPNMQFIVTTHSPFIAQSATSGCVIRLARPDEEVASRVYAGGDLESVLAGTADDVYLSSLFGIESTRSAYGEALIEEASRLETLILDGLATDEDVTRHRQLKGLLPASADLLAVLKALQTRLE